MKSVKKKLVQAIAVIIVSPLLVLYAIIGRVSSEGSFSTFSQMLGLLPGKMGSYLRVAFYRFAMRSCAPDCFIGFLAVFSQQDTEIGRGVYIGPGCNIGMCVIGADTLLGSGVHVISGTRQHHYDDLEIPIRQQGGEYQKIAIGEDCWIGNAALIMADVGKKSIIGAGSVVSKEVPAYSIVVGNPARVIKSRLD
ncbi:Putative acetyltransferase [Thiorhodovibrio winogradskyi]|uniref:Acetyltransferase n=1 Tax=Thiorhodovibrio winogradskyi TaxID=77007 RepID=A0ABZ0SAZ4_9GAMM|nr:acyltransferase [Thiorhodovibrio winogradskyi]